ncbi:MAG: HK97 family phage prohead protease [Solirubrobacterales bacterium]
MLHKTLAAETTVTEPELGQFEAIASAWEADREGDVIERGAFDKTIAAWRDSGKNLPLLFEHSSTAVGHVDPASMPATDAGLVVAGEIDRTESEGRQAWRTIKAGSAGFSIGYMAEGRPRKGGGRTLTSIDLLEISVTSKPMHPATRALSWKSAGDQPPPFDFRMPTDAEIRERAARAEVADLLSTKSSKPEQPSIRVIEFDA